MHLAQQIYDFDTLGLPAWDVNSITSAADTSYYMHNKCPHETLWWIDLIWWVGNGWWRGLKYTLSRKMIVTNGINTFKSVFVICWVFKKLFFNSAQNVGINIASGGAARICRHSQSIQAHLCWSPWILISSIKVYSVLTLNWPKFYWS